MESLYYVMAILGCGDDGQACRQERIAPQRYASVMQCQAAMATELASAGDLLYPVVQATCERRGTVIAARPDAKRG